jgi:hypothetical protein
LQAQRIRSIRSSPMTVAITNAMCRDGVRRVRLTTMRRAQAQRGRAHGLQ